MSTLMWLIQILVLLMSYKPLAQVSAHLHTNHSKVMLFHDVWLRSMCQSLEKMVVVEQEYPGSVEHIFSPGCVPLRRCSGCCNDEKLECSPILTHNVTMQLVRITPVQRTKQYVQLSFLEHQLCECRLKRSLAKYYSPSRQRLRNQNKRRKGKKRENRGKSVLHSAMMHNGHLS